MAIKRKAITISINGAEFLELEAKAKEAGLTVPAYVRARCGFEGWIARGREMQSRAQTASRQSVMALDRLPVTMMFTEAEHSQVVEKAAAEGLSVPQYIRTRCGFEVRWTSLPHTEERDREEDDAWERLKRLGLNPVEYFPLEK